MQMRKYIPVLTVRMLSPVVWDLRRHEEAVHHESLSPKSAFLELCWMMYVLQMISSQPHLISKMA